MLNLFIAKREKELQHKHLFFVVVVENSLQDGHQIFVIICLIKNSDLHLIIVVAMSFLSFKVKLFWECQFLFTESTHWADSL